MGINLVVIVGNSNGISLQELKGALLQEPLLGPLAWNPIRGHGGDELSPWKEFLWDGKPYFTWMLSPRLSSFDVHALPEEPDAVDSRSITFLKIMSLIEKIAGGPVYTGNDVVNLAHPEEADEQRGYSFWLPVELDFQLKGWRDIAQREAEASLIF